MARSTVGNDGVRNYLSFGTAVCLLLILIGSVAARQNDPESPNPVLISDPGSARALAVIAENWDGSFPSASSGTFRSGSRIVTFVSGIDLLPGEGGNAFRVFAEDRNGRKYRFVVEEIKRLSKRPPTYALILRLFDRGGYSGQPSRGELLVRVAWRGNASNRLVLFLGKRDAQLANDHKPFPSGESAVSPGTAQRFSTNADRKRFMEQASFGPNDTLDFRLRQIGFRRWIEEQFYTPYPTIPYPNFPQMHGDGNIGCGGPYGASPQISLCHRNHYWAYNNQKWLMLEALYGDDQLRRRMSWALHKIWVVAASTVYQQRWMQEYFEILDRHAFGNYRDLMYEMTLSPAMGEYLDMTRSTSQNPNENYPRELLQLFTTGLYMLNQDGTFILDGQGNRIATYDQDKINEFTKVFTGWTHCNNGNEPACSNAVVGAPNFIDPMYLTSRDGHDLTAKSLFNYPGGPNSTIAACANCTTDAARSSYAYDSLNKTLDNIFHHPNVGPYIGKILIQHFVTSDPSPAYVERVAAAFNNNGSGVRGDMKAVTRAILLDPEARGSRKTEPTYGKLREPFQHLTNLLRQFNVRAGNHIANVGLANPPASCQNRSDGVFEWAAREAGQDLLNPPTVFSYYQPDYVVPGTDILGPEFAIANTGTSFERNTHIYYFSNWGVGYTQPTVAEPYPYVPCGTSIDRTEPSAWAAADPTGNLLIENLNQKLMHGTMSEAMKTKVRTAINFNIDPSFKASQAIYLIASSSQYQIQR